MQAKELFPLFKQSFVKKLAQELIIAVCLRQVDFLTNGQLDLITIGRHIMLTIYCCYYTSSLLFIRIKGSYAVMLDYYLKLIGETRIKLNWQAVRIEYQSSSGMLLFCNYCELVFAGNGTRPICVCACARVCGCIKK